MCGTNQYESTSFEKLKQEFQEFLQSRYSKCEENIRKFL